MRREKERVRGAGGEIDKEKENREGESVMRERGKDREKSV